MLFAEMSNYYARLLAQYVPLGWEQKTGLEWTAFLASLPKHQLTLKCLTLIHCSLWVK